MMDVKTKKKKALNAAMVAVAAAIVVAGGLFVANLRGGAAPSEEDGAPAIAVERTVGTVNVVRGGIGYGLDAGSALQDGDVVETGVDSSVEVSVEGTGSAVLGVSAGMTVRTAGDSAAAADDAQVDGTSAGDGAQLGDQASTDGEPSGESAFLAGEQAGDQTGAGGAQDDGSAAGGDAQAAASVPTFELSEGEIFIDAAASDAGDAASAPAIGVSSALVSARSADAAYLLSAHTGSAAVQVLGGSVELSDGAVVEAGQVASFSAQEDGSVASSTAQLEAAALDDFAIAQAQRSLEAGRTLCFGADELSRVVADREAAKAAQEEAAKAADEEAAKAEAEKAEAEDGEQAESEASEPEGSPAPDAGGEGSGEGVGQESGQPQAPEGEGGGQQAPDEPAAPPEPAKKTVTIEIRCDTILSNWADLAPGKSAFVPVDGTVLAATTVEFSDGETVFDVLSRACAEHGIQLEYSYTPVYGSYYIEGIDNLYEFDCGPQSGWTYQVNSYPPVYGSSGYVVSDGDAIVWRYTCKGFGADVGVAAG